jgi:hypothetical protein
MQSSSKNAPATVPHLQAMLRMAEGSLTTAKQSKTLLSLAEQQQLTSALVALQSVQRSIQVSRIRY